MSSFVSPATALVSPAPSIVSPATSIVSPATSISGGVIVPAFNWANNSSGTVNGGTQTTFALGTFNATGSDGTIAANDLLVVVVALAAGSDPGAISLAAGTGATWTKAYDAYVFTTTRTAFFWKLANGTEPSSYTVTWANSGSVSAVAGWAIADFSGLATSSTLDVSQTAASSGIQTIQAPSITPTKTGELMVCLFGQTGGANPYTPDSNLTNVVNNQASSTTRPFVAIGYKVLSGTGATAAPQITSGAVADWSAGSFGFAHV